MEIFEVIDSAWNRENSPNLIGKRLASAPSYTQVRPYNGCRHCRVELPAGSKAQYCDSDCKRLASNQRRRALHTALQNIGLTKTKYGWE